MCFEINKQTIKTKQNKQTNTQTRLDGFISAVDASTGKITLTYCSVHTRGADDPYLRRTIGTTLLKHQKHTHYNLQSVCVLKLTNKLAKQNKHTNVFVIAVDASPGKITLTCATEFGIRGWC